MLLLTKEDIKKVFTIKDAIETNKQAFVQVVEGTCEIPLRTQVLAPKYDGCFLFMPAYAPEIDRASLKNVNIFPHNIDEGKTSAPAQILLIDGKDGFVKAVMNGTYVTQLRTGAASGLAFELLGRKDSKIGALIGTGGQAAMQLEAMLAVRDLDEVRVFDLNYDRTVQFTEAMKEELKQYNTKIVAVTSSDEAIDNADLLITVTPSTKPVFDATKVKAGCTVSCVGAYQHHMQEMDPVILNLASKIYFDSKEAVLSESGDILIPLAEGTITEKDFTGDIGNVIKGELVGRESDDEIIVFETVGMGAQDLMAANAIYEKALASNVGLNWEE